MKHIQLSLTICLRYKGNHNLFHLSRAVHNLPLKINLGKTDSIYSPRPHPACISRPFPTSPGVPGLDRINGGLHSDSWNRNVLALIDHRAPSWPLVLLAGRQTPILRVKYRVRCTWIQTDHWSPGGKLTPPQVNF